MSREVGKGEVSRGQSDALATIRYTFNVVDDGQLIVSQIDCIVSITSMPTSLFTIGWMCCRRQVGRECQRRQRTQDRHFSSYFSRERDRLPK